MTGLHRKLLRDLITLRSQVLTISVLIVGGISVLVSSWSSYQSLELSLNSFYQDYKFADVFSEVVRSPMTVAEKVSRLPGVERLETRIIKEGLIDVPGQSEPALGRFISWAGPNQAINLIYLRQGRLPYASSNPATAFEVVVHESFALAHKLKVGDTLRSLLDGQQRRFIISGIGISPEYVYALSPLAPLPDDKHFGIFWLRQQDLESLTGMENTFNSLQIKTAKNTNVAELKRQIDQILQPYGNIQSYDRSLQLSHIFLEGEINEQRVMAIVIPTIFLAVAMFILNVILSRLISLHRGEIATLKALGYSAWSLTIHYFQLVTIILLIGTGPAILAGAGIGHWYAGLYADFFRFPSIDFSLSGTSILLGILAGLIPGWIGAAGALAKVFSLQPAEALRPLSPPSFQKGLLDKIGLTSRLSPYSKIVLRSLLFRPLRLLLGVLGISMSLAIIINGSFWSDVINFMMDRQFNEMRREDLTVRLLTPQPLRVFSELRAISGILMVEGERSTPVAMSFRNFKKDIGILAWENGAQLSRVLDKQGNTIVPISGGVLLSRFFEKEFNLRVGDRVNFKVLEGSQDQFTVPVTGFVDDLIGQQAYAEKKDLHMWLKEMPVYDTLQLKIDPSLGEKIYVALKERPQVKAITIRKLLLKSFTNTVADMIMTFTFILYIFAVAIAGAVIYNSARISFSERGWELASLRILGFDIRPTFEILFIDIGIQVFLSLIPGLIFGYWLSYLSTVLIHNKTFSFPLVINPATYGAAILILILTFLASGIFLYRKVNALDFSQALKARE